MVPSDRSLLLKGRSGLENSYLVSNGLHLVLLRQGDENLWEGNYEAAERLYLKCLNYIAWMPEPKFRLALCNLLQR